MSNDQQPVNIPIKITADQSSISAAQNRISELEDEIKRLARETDNFTNVTSDQTRQLKNVTNELGAYRKAVQGLGTGNKAAADDVEALNQSLHRVDSTLSKIKTNRYDEAFDRISREVGLAGDAESALRTIGGAAGAAGASGVAQGLGAAAELPAVLEALPRLKVAVTGLPSVLSSAAAALGPTGIGLGAAAVVAGLTVGELSKRLEEMKRRAEETANQILETNRIGASVEQLLDRGDIEGATQLYIQQLDLVDLKLRESARQAADVDWQETAVQIENAQQGIFSDLADSIALFKTETEQTRDNVVSDAKVIDDALKTASNNLTVMGNAFADRGLNIDALVEKTREQEQAETDLMDTRSRAVIELANAAGRELAMQQRADKATTEQNQARRQAIEEESAQIQAQIDTLRESGDTSEIVMNQLAGLTQRLGELGAEAEYIDRTALANSKHRDQQIKAAAEAEEKRRISIEETRKAEEKHTEAQQKALDILQQYNEKIVDIAKKRAEEESKAYDRLEDARDKAQLALDRGADDAALKAQRDTLQAELDIQRQRRDAAVQLADDLADIQTNAANEEKQLARERNFAAIFALRERTNQELQNRSKEYSRTERDTQTAANDQRDDLLRAQDQEREDRQRNYERALEDAQSQYDKEYALAKTNEEKALAELKTWKDMETAALTAAYGTQYAIITTFGAAAAAALQQQLTGATIFSGVKSGVKAAEGTKSGQTGSGDKTYSRGGDRTTNSTTDSHNTYHVTQQVNGARDPQAVGQDVMKRLARVMK